MESKQYLKFGNTTEAKIVSYKTKLSYGIEDIITDQHQEQDNYMYDLNYKKFTHISGLF